MKRNSLWNTKKQLPAVFFFLVIGLTGCEENATPTTTEYTVTFDAGTGGTLTGSATVKVKSGEKVAKPTDPTRDGFTFVEWRKTGATTAFPFDTETITANITLTAQWAQNFTVIFAGEDITTPPQTVPDGGMADEPPTPTRTDYTFVNWLKPDGGGAFDFTTDAITADITLTAEWLAITFTVTFAGENINIQPQTVADGGMANRPPTDPTRDGFTFFNWYEEATFNELYDFSTAVTSNITVYARWLSNTKYTVRFDAKEGLFADGNRYSTVQISEGEKLPKPIDPTRDGFSLVEWQKAGGSAFDFDTETITANITLTAQWIGVPNTLGDVAIGLNDANTAYTVNYTYTNPQGGTTGGTPEITWFLSDNADGTNATQVSTGATYTLAKENRYTKYLVASVRVMAATGEVTPTVTVVRSPGFSTEATRGVTSTRFSGRNAHTSVRFDDKIWVIGGTAGGDEVWSSADGITWTKASDPTAQNPRFSGRYNHTSVVLNDTIWVIGGADDTNSLNDVWFSADGSTWVKKPDATAQNPRFSPRSRHTSVAFDDKLWVIGGLNDNFEVLNDVWSSEDGATWTQVTNTMTGAAFSGRSGHASVFFKDKLWVIGGNSGGNKNDVWSSEDGATWTQVTAAAQFSGRANHAAVAFDGKIWVIGGFDESRQNDVWSSEDGINWIEYPEVPESSRFSPRESHTSVAFDDKIWVIGGVVGTLGNAGDDVWY